MNVTAPGSGTPTGTVTFMDGGVPIAAVCAETVTGAGVATCNVGFDTAGTHAITAVYSGDSNFTGSTSSAFTQTTSPGATAAMIASSADPVGGRPVSLVHRNRVRRCTRRRDPHRDRRVPGRRIDRHRVRDAGTGRGMASCNVTYASAGSHAITAVYSGDPDFAGSTSPVLTQTDQSRSRIGDSGHIVGEHLGVR